MTTINQLHIRLLDDDDNALAFRDMLICDAENLNDDYIADIASDWGISLATAHRLAELRKSLGDAELAIYRYADSLCPIHAIDYAICFDDETAECAQIRITCPSHDT